MQKRILKVAILAALAVILVLSFAGVALADQTWSDLPDTVTAKYGITDNQVASISDGYPGGLWKPLQNVTRGQFIKMLVLNFGIAQASPATPSFTDVPKDNLYYPFVEGAKAAQVTNGFSGAVFKPGDNITRDQALAMIVRYVAMKNGYTLATMYTAGEITALLAGFGDSASVSSALKTEMAFAIDFGITLGNSVGNLDPQGKLTRIQGAAMLIRAKLMVPVAPVVPTKIEMVSADKAENLIGVAHQVTFKVTQAGGAAAPGVLVDFDTMFADVFYVGNISPQAAMTDANGEVTVNLISAEPGTERVSAAVNGLAAIYTTKYWLALDEVYTVGEYDYEDGAYLAENNAGDAHDWAVRVIVIGPGPRSTSQQDWYNWISTAPFDPTNIKAADGIDGPDDDAWYGDELDMLDIDYVPRTMAGINVEWSIVNVVDDNPSTTTKDETVPSVGDITAVDGVNITPAQTAVGHTDADGLSTITIESEETGQTRTEAVATYVGNPYPKLLFNHGTFDSDSGETQHMIDWDDQPTGDAVQLKTWIPHIIGGDTDGPITPLYAVNNTGEVETYTLDLADVFGNPIPGYTVEWWIQGVGEFKTDGTTWSGIGEQNKDVDLTDADGQASAMVKSLVPGQTIIHLKVMDKYGLPYKEWNVVKQWYSIDDVSLGYIDEDDDFVDYAENVVNTSHTWTAMVSGAKYVYTIYDLNGNGLRDDVVLIGNRADMKAVAGHYANFDGSIGAAKDAGDDVAVGIPFMPDDAVTPVWYVRFADIIMADNEFWVDMIGHVYATVGTEERVVVDDDIREVWAGLAGKGVNFFTNIGGDPTAPYTDGTPWTTITSNTSLPPAVAAPALVQRVGSITGFAAPWVNKTVGGVVYDYDAVTDDMGLATVTINSTVKGYQYVWAVVDYPENPQDGNAALPLSWHELRYDLATKLWTPDTSTPGIRVFANDAAPFAEGANWTNPVLSWAGYTSVLDLVTIAAPLAGTQATGFTATAAGGATGPITALSAVASGTGYTASDVGRAVTIAAPTSTQAVATTGAPGALGVLVQGNLTITNAGSGYSTAPLVTIVPNGPFTTQATATATVANGLVTAITYVNVGSGYTVAPTIQIGAPNPVTATATILTVTTNQVAALNLVTPGSGYTNATYAVTIPMPLKTTATATATVLGGVIQTVNMTNNGVGYITAPAVTFGGGFGATATANLSGTTVGSVTVNTGGTGYGVGLQASGTADDANPNYEVIAVQVFDQYGNALPDYFVTWEILGQGTTTPGTEDTYHPYAHFMDSAGPQGDPVKNPAHDDPDTDTDPGIVATSVAGTGDRQPHVDSNPIWDNGAAPVGDADDDWGWGWTLDGQINYTLDLASAAHITLVLDETAGDLEYDHITNIINVKVYTPTGALLEDFEVTKEWSLDAPVLTTINLSVGETATGPWVTALTSNVSPVYYRAQLLDQYGDPWTSNVNVLIRTSGPFDDTVAGAAIAAPNASGISIAAFPTTWDTGLHTMTVYYDTINTNGQLTAGELTSNSATVNVQ